MAGTFLRKFSPDNRQRSLSVEAVNAIRSYAWPGNVRELENRIRRAITFSDSLIIRPSDLGFGMPDDGLLLNLKKAREDLEMRFVNLAVLKHKGNISRAAEELGLSRPTVHQIIKKYNMNDAARKG
ncbi:MAG: helix-turn-helix domain-containing protein [Deltaproteobacteria bacterium]|nr:helix-turn-helix domain-containing protein [Deltaproteobacteria bacterium]